MRNYRATPHQTTGKSPAELMFPNRHFKTKVPTAKPVTQYHQDEEVRDRQKKEIMKAAGMLTGSSMLKSMMYALMI